MKISRRKFLKSTAAAVTATTVAASTPFTLGSPKDKDKIVQIDTEDGWKDIPMNLLKKGDVFRLREKGKTVLSSTAMCNPYLVSPDIWGVQIYKDVKKENRVYKPPKKR